jgi:hypothetical protein
MEVNGQLYTLVVLPPGEKGPLYPLEGKAGWAQSPVSATADNRTPIPWSRSAWRVQSL